MRIDNKNSEYCAGSQHGSQQDPSAGNQFKAQLKRFMKILEVENATQLANAIGRSGQAIREWRSKQRIPGIWITKISAKYNISADWLLTGKGPMRREESRVAESRLEYKASPQIPAPQGLDIQYFDLVPVVETYLNAGGDAFIPSEMICGYCAFRKDWLHRVASSPRNAVLVPVRGPSMEPTILNGDMVMIDTGKKRIYDGCIYAIGIGETISIKRLYPLPDGRIRVTSDNEQYLPEDVLPQDLRIIGQVIWFARELIK